MFKLWKFIKFNKNKKLQLDQNQILVLATNKTNYTQDELKQLWLKEYLANAEDQFLDQFNQQIDNLKQEYISKSQMIIMESLNRLDYQFFRDEFIVKVHCPNNEIKSRLVGLNGRNKKAFERTCGVELIINENDEYLGLSSANHIKRELAHMVLTKLLEIKNIEPHKIVNFYQEAKIQFEEHVYNIGKQVIEKTLKISNINPKLYLYVGYLKYRYSFGQNILEHSIEAAFIAEQLARELNIDSHLAKICAFFHDIGKSINHETDTDHVEQGIKLAEQFGLPNEVIHAIAAHHDDIVVTSLYDSVTKLADRISACKPEARKNNKDDFYHRAKVYEDICYQFKEVEHCYVLKSGFVVKVIVKPNLVKDEALSLLAYQIKQAFENNTLTKSYVVTIELIKENSLKVKTTKK